MCQYILFYKLMSKRRVYISISMGGRGMESLLVLQMQLTIKLSHLGTHLEVSYNSLELLLVDQCCKPSVNILEWLAKLGIHNL